MNYINSYYPKAGEYDNARFSITWLDENLIHFRVIRKSQVDHVEMTFVNTTGPFVVIVHLCNGTKIHFPMNESRQRTEEFMVSICDLVRV